jgi:Predicted metal-dependent phosphoesterases (PHP family)
MYADLHAHTTASDGTLTPAELVRAAHAAGIAYLAVTDHDTVAGVPEAQATARALGITLIPGVELSAKGEPGECHLLGLNIDPTHPPLVERLAELSENRRTRNARMAERLTQLGAPVTLEEVAALAPEGANLGRPHFAKALVARGHVRDVAEAFDKYLGDGRPGHIAKETLSPADAVAMVHEAGGLCFLAHPGLLRLHEHITDEGFVRRLQAFGLDGIEAYYSKYSPAQTERYLRLADKLGLLVTGGSDFHGANKPDTPLGAVIDGAPLPADRLPQALLSP